MQFIHLARSGLTAVALAVSTLAAQATVVNLDATVADFSVTETFAAGTYNVTWIGASGGGLYDAWGAAVSSSPTADNGHAKYRDAFAVSFNGAAAQVVGSFGPYTPDTAAAALADAQANPTTFTFATTTTAVFTIPDTSFNDNIGGVSLSITSAVPEADASVMALAGLGLIGFIARRRRAASSEQR